MLPDWLPAPGEPVGVAPLSAPWAFDRTVLPKHGQICLIESMDRSEPALLGLALADRAAAAARSVLVVLVSADTELATDNDLVIPRDAAQTGYDVMVRTDLVAPVFVVQVGACVGQVDRDDLALVERALIDGPLALPISRRGFLMYPEGDPRLPGKDADADRLARLSAECITELLLKEQVLLTAEEYARNPLILSVLADRDVRMIGEEIPDPAPLPPGFPGDVFADAAMALLLAGVTTGRPLAPSDGVEATPDVVDAADVPSAVQEKIIDGTRRSVCVLASSPSGEARRAFRRLLHPSSRGVQMVVENVYA